MTDRLEPISLPDPVRSGASLLEAQNLTAGYGDAVVLEKVSFSFSPGARVALLGRNGVGKTTLILTLMGFTRLRAGRLFWQGTDLAPLSPIRRARMGLGWVPQERAVFPSLTVDEHLSAVARPGPLTAAAVYELFPRLAERKHHGGQQLSGGEQQMLAIARALVTNPRLLLLDEPFEGLAPIVIQELTRILRELSAHRAMALLLVEQHARLALALTDHAIVLDRGKVVHQGRSQELLADAAFLHRLLTVG